MDAIRILIADDHTFYREGVRTMLGAMPEAEVVGEAASGDEAVAQAAALQPDIILMDIKMPGLNGIEATRTIDAGPGVVRDAVDDVGAGLRGLKQRHVALAGRDKRMRVELVDVENEVC
jgi:CheY-like chemotaxis protein